MRRYDFEPQKRIPTFDVGAWFNAKEKPMKWVTRANVKVDRVACPWLIRTFIDRDAEFLFVPVGEVEGVARKSGAIPYDVAGVELGHHGEECSFDAIVKTYKVDDDAVGRL